MAIEFTYYFRSGSYNDRIIISVHALNTDYQKRNSHDTKEYLDNYVVSYLKNRAKQIKLYMIVESFRLYLTKGFYIEITILLRS